MHIHASKRPHAGDVVEAVLAGDVEHQHHTVRSPVVCGGECTEPLLALRERSNQSTTEHGRADMAEPNMAEPNMAEPNMAVWGPTWWPPTRFYYAVGELSRSQKQHSGRVRDEQVNMRQRIADQLKKVMDHYVSMVSVAGTPRAAVFEPTWSITCIKKKQLVAKTTLRPCPRC